MLLDKPWTQLTTQYKLMNNFLARHNKVKRLAIVKKAKLSLKNYKSLRKECQDGRTILNNILQGEEKNDELIKLVADKERRRLYRNMTIENVVENVDRRSFAMRKENDRLKYRKLNLEQKLKELKGKKMLIEKQIATKDTGACKDIEIQKQKIMDVKKKIANSRIRLKAIEHVNIVYKKIRQVLTQDECYYEPILNSLSNDIQDQNEFIAHILYLGKPAIKQFKALQDEFKITSHRLNQDINIIMNTVRLQKHIFKKKQPSTLKSPKTVKLAKEHYMRTTCSMATLSDEYERTYKLIQDIRFATLSLNSRQIYPRLIAQTERNSKLKKQIVWESMKLSALDTKIKFSNVMMDVLRNDLTEQDLARMEFIELLKDQVTEEDNTTEEIQEAIKRTNDIFVVLKFFFWKLYDILYYVGRNHQTLRMNYPTPYLALPLLKFEMLDKLASPPAPMEEDLRYLYVFIHRKLSSLVSAYDTLTSTAHQKSFNIKENLLKKHRNTFMNDFLVIVQDMDEYNPKNYSRASIERNTLYNDNESESQPLVTRQTIKKQSKLLLSREQSISTTSHANILAV